MNKKNMEKIGDMEFIDFEDVLDRDLGKVGTPKRDEFERKVDESVRAQIVDNKTDLGKNLPYSLNMRDELR